MYSAPCFLASSDQLLEHRQPRQLLGAAGGNHQGLLHGIPPTAQFCLPPGCARNIAAMQKP